MSIGKAVLLGRGTKANRNPCRSSSRSARALLTRLLVSIYLPLVNTYHNAQLDALGDGTRRAILARLLSAGPLAVSDIALDFDVSRPAISQHLRVLKDAQLVLDHPRGTRRLYELNPQGFHMLQQYFDQFWMQALIAFKAKAEERPQHAAPKTNRRKP